MFCKKCGKQIPDDANFCPYCGKHLNGEIPPQKNNSIRNIIIGAIVFILFVTALTTRNNSTDSASGAGMMNLLMIIVIISIFVGIFIRLMRK